MILRDKIDILKPQTTKDSKGISKTTYSADRTIQADFQPLKYSIQNRPFGVTDKTSNLVLLNDQNIMQAYYLPDGNINQFNISNRVMFNNNQYIIDAILPYKRHFELYVEKVI